MRKFLALAVIGTAFVVTSAAQAAVVVDVTQQGAGSLLWDITITTTAGERVGGLALLGNANVVSLALNAGNAGIDPLLSSLVPDVIGDGRAAIGINNTGVGVAIATGAVPVLIGSLSINGPVCIGPAGSICSAVDVTPGDELFGYTIAADDVAATPITNFTVNQRPVPEPASALLLGLGLAGMSLIRRKA